MAYSPYGKNVPYGNICIDIFSSLMKTSLKMVWVCVDLIALAHKEMALIRSRVKPQKTYEVKDTTISNLW